jgi:hypothetical protein
MILQIIISNWIASAIGSCILLMVSIIAYFMIRYFSGQDKINDELSASIKELSGTLTHVNASLIIQNSEINYLKQDAESRRLNCEKHFEKIEKIIEE